MTKGQAILIKAEMDESKLRENSAIKEIDSVYCVEGISLGSTGMDPSGIGVVPIGKLTSGSWGFSLPSAWNSGYADTHGLTEISAREYAQNDYGHIKAYIKISQSITRMPGGIVELTSLSANYDGRCGKENGGFGMTYALHAGTTIYLDVEEMDNDTESR